MISIVVAYAHNRAIGKDGSIPWRLPDDLKYFKRITSGHTIVMGRKTFASIGRPLPQRRNIVLTHAHDIHLPDIEIVHSPAEVFALGDVFIIGGAAIYQQFIDVADRLYITEIALDIEGDTFFPAWDHQAFTQVSAQEGVVDEKNIFPHTFFVYQRKTAQLS